MGNYRKFYELIDRESLYSSCNLLENHIAYELLTSLIDSEFKNKKCLEIGSGKGILQDIVDDYTGLDLVESLSKYYRKPFYVVNADGTYPFDNDLFDVIWSYAVHEHIPNLNQALMELKRVLKVGGIVIFWPAWQCRPWAAEGYAVRPYSDFSFKGKLIKVLIPLRNLVCWRSLFIFPKRIYRHLLYLFGRRYNKILCKNITPNYDKYWTSDSDACNNIDPHDAILWFESNGLKCLSHSMHLKALLVKNGPLLLQKVQ